MITSAKIPALFRLGLNEILAKQPQLPELWTEIDKNFEQDVEMRNLGAANIKNEGAALTYEDMGQRIITYYFPKVVTNGYQITYEAMSDNLYKNQFFQQSTELADSLRVTRNILAASVLNNAFNPAYPSGDGQPVCSTSHPIDGGVYTNTFGGDAPAIDFSEAGLEAALIAISKFRSQSGTLVQTKAQKLVIPVELQFEAIRLLGSEFRVGVANNDINAIVNKNYIPMGYHINNYLLNPSAWFVLTDAPSGFKHFQREKITTDVYVDPDTKSIKCSAMERYSYGITNCRAVFGSKGA